MPLTVPAKIDKDHFIDNDTGDSSFENAMKKELNHLRDDPTNWNPENWIPFNQTQKTDGFNGEIHGVVLIVGEEDTKIETEFDKVAKILDKSVETALILDGKVRPKETGQEGHEQ